MSTSEQNQRIGAFVTNRWLVGLLVALTISMGGYIFRGIDKGAEAQSTQIEALQKRASSLELELTQQKVTLLIQYTEIIRRLDRMESVIYGSVVSGKPRAPERGSP